MVNSFMYRCSSCALHIDHNVSCALGRPYVILIETPLADEENGTQES